MVRSSLESPDQMQGNSRICQLIGGRVSKTQPRQHISRPLLDLPPALPPLLSFPLHSFRDTECQFCNNIAMFISSELFHIRDSSPDFEAMSTHMEDDSQKCRRNSSVLGKRSRRESCNSSSNMSQFTCVARIFKLRVKLTPADHNRPRKTKTFMTVKLPGDSASALFKSLPTSLPDRETFEHRLDGQQGEGFISFQRHDRSPTTKSRRRIAAPKRPKLPARAHTEPSTSQSISTPPLLTPCHVCHKAPRLKKDLEAYEDCWRCDERTCYICIRQCQADCGSRKVCRQCCVEHGEDGDVYCLDCLERAQDHDMED